MLSLFFILTDYSIKIHSYRTALLVQWVRFTEPTALLVQWVRLQCGGPGFDSWHSQINQIVLQKDLFYLTSKTKVALS